MLAWAENSDRIANFMEFVNGNLSYEVGRLVDWPETMFPERYRGIIVSDERRDQEGRLRYLLKQGVKENLVETPEEWPGVNSVKSLCYGTEFFGYWYDRTQELGTATNQRMPWVRRVTDGFLGKTWRVLGDRRTAQRRSQPRIKGTGRPLIFGGDPVLRSCLGG